MRNEHVNDKAVQPAKKLTSRLALFGKRFASDEVRRDGLIMVIAGLATGLLNYLYQLAMGIMLTPAEFGTLFSLFSLFMIVVWIAQSIQTPVTKFVSTFKAQGNMGMVNYLWRLSLAGSLLIGLGVFVIVSAVSPLISRFFHSDNTLYIVLIFSACIPAFAVPVNNGILQGLQKFTALGFSNGLWALIRLVLAVLLVHLGMGIYGGILPILVAFIIQFLVTSYLLKRLSEYRKEKVDIKTLKSYTGHALIVLAFFAVITNIDVVLAKYYLSSDDAGIYSAVSVLGRIVLFATTGIAVAMFPKTSDLFENGKPHHPLLRKATVYVLLIGGGIVIFYLIFSNFISSFVLRDKYAYDNIDLFKYGLSMLFFALSFLIVNYLLSVNNIKKLAIVLAGVTAVEVVLICLFHSSISQIVNVMLASSSLCLLAIYPLYYRVKTGSDYA